MELYFVLFSGVALGGVAIWILLRGRAEVAAAAVSAELQPRIAAAEASLAAARGESDRLRTELADAAAERDRLRTRNAQVEARLESERSGFAEKLDLLQQAKDALGDQFRVLANSILEENGKKFAQQNQTQLSSLLNPLGEKLKDFESRVQNAYDSESQQRAALRSEISRLVEANAKISSDTTNLARALKGDSKAQGAWGEMILERALEMAGLTRDREYRVQQSYSGESGGRLRPDVIVDLPEGRHMVIDSKVSLTSYERFCSAANEQERQRELALHLASMRNHMADLGKKDYQRIHDLDTLDFVIMFVPIESAYSLAVANDAALTQDALERNVLIVYPGTLLMALRTIAHVWRYEYQNRNAQEIARQAGALYDKFVGFVSDLKEVGERLGRAQAAYDSAFGKLSTGRGNLVRSAERIRALGVKPAKSLPGALVDSAEENAEG